MVSSDLLVSFCDCFCDFISLCDLLSLFQYVIRNVFLWWFACYATCTCVRIWPKPRSSVRAYLLKLFPFKTLTWNLFAELSTRWQSLDVRCMYLHCWNVESLKGYMWGTSAGVCSCRLPQTWRLSHWALPTLLVLRDDRRCKQPILIPGSWPGGLTHSMDISR